CEFVVFRNQHLGCRMPIWKFIIQPALSAILLSVLFGLPVHAQDEQSATLSYSGLVPGGVRRTATESWQLYYFTINNLTGSDRQARLLMSYDGQGDVMYGRDLWVPAHCRVASWM